MNVLPDLPLTIRSLSDGESGRLHRLHSGLWADPKTSCITCLGKKVFQGRSGETECRCVDQWRLHRFLLNAGVPLNYQRLDWTDVDDQVPGSVQEAIMEYAEEAEHLLSTGFGAILLGTSGTGKTLLAVLLLKNLLAQGYDGYFTTFNDLLDAYTSGWTSREDKDWFTRRVTNAGVLVIDDVGKESKGRENITNSLFDIVIRNRVASDKPTIITTNYSMEEMRSGYGGAVMSLLAEKCFDYEVTGRDFRERAKQRTLDEVKARVRRPVTLA